MSFIDWLYSNRPEGLQLKSQPWGTLHILVLLGCIGVIVLLALLLKNRSDKAKYIAIFAIAMGILFFEIARRIINFTREGFNWNDIDGVLYTLDGKTLDELKSMSAIEQLDYVKKYLLIQKNAKKIEGKQKFFYNFAAITALLNAIIFFAYPDAGFKNHIAFEEVYSIGTHCLLLIGSISMMTLGHTDFRYNRGKEKIWWEYICYAGVFLYAFLEIVLHIEDDPLYFMPGNGVLDVVSLPYPLYVVVYIIFVFGII